MNRREGRSWWGLYGLVPVIVGLLYLIATLRVGVVVDDILDMAVVVAVGALTLLWLDRHADLVGSEGVDARAEEESLADQGIEPGRYAPSLTGRQANYRHVMLARTDAPGRFDGNKPRSVNAAGHLDGHDSGR